MEKSVSLICGCNSTFCNSFQHLVKDDIELKPFGKTVILWWCVTNRRSTHWWCESIHKWLSLDSPRKQAK